MSFSTSNSPVVASTKDADLQKLRPLLERKTGAKGIKHLDVSENPIADAALVHLRDFTMLERLDLSWTQITDAGLEHLKELKGLTALNLKKTKFSAEGVAELQKALPKCKIEGE